MFKLEALKQKELNLEEDANKTSKPILIPSFHFKESGNILEILNGEGGSVSYGNLVDGYVSNKPSSSNSTQSQINPFVPTSFQIINASSNLPEKAKLCEHPECSIQLDENNICKAPNDVKLPHLICNMIRCYDFLDN